jgi:PAS domain S-box-containing protein
MAFSDSAEELEYLHRCMSDLVSVLALPAVWSGQEPRQIVTTFHDALSATLNLDFLYTQVRIDALGEPVEVLRTAPHYAARQNADKIRQALDMRLGDDPRKWPAEVRIHLGGQETSLLSTRLGIEGEFGIVVAGSERADFPTQAERLLLGVAANQVTVGLQQARLLNEQKQVASELDRRVAEQTASLAAANEELKREIAERKIVEEQLLASEGSLKTSGARLRLVIDTIPSLSWCNLPDGSNEFLSKGWHDYTGLSPEEAHGWGWQVAFHVQDLPPLMKKWQELLISGEPGEIEARLRRHDDVYRWFLIQVAPLREAGTIVRWYGTSTDINDRKLAEEALRASEINLRQIVNSIPGLICTMNPAGEIEELNQPLLEYFGKTPEELRGWRMTDAVHPDDLPEVIKAYRYSIETGTPYAIEHRCRRADGVYQWFQVRASAVRDADGQITGWYVLLTDIDDRKRAGEALQASERNLALTINTIPALAWSARADGTADSFNRHYLDYVGLTQEQAQDWGWADAVHPDDRNGLIDAWQFTMKSDKGGECEARLRRFDGVYRWFLIRTNPLRDESGAIVKWYGTNTDIDDRKRAEEELRRSEARKTAILDSALDCIVTIDHEGCITEFNPAAEHTFGYRRIEVMGKRLSDIVIPASHREKHRQGLLRYLATGETRVLGRRLELTAVRADGTEFPVELAITRIPLEGDPSFTGYLRDITERKQAEEELRRSEAFLAEGQRLSGTGSFFWRLATGRIVWSDQLYRIFELDPGLTMTLELIGSRVHPEDRYIFHDTVERARSGRDLKYEHRLLLPGNRVKYLQLVGHGTRANDGQWEYIGAVRDVTERRLSEEALDKARSELAHVTRITSLGMLTASIAHEVNQPLSGIITNASTCLRMLSGDPPNIEGARETARRTIRDGNRASEVVTRLRALFKRKEIAAESIDLNDAVRELIALSLSELQSDRIMVRNEFAENLPAVKGDRIQIQQVILNLLRNASDAMRDVEDRPRQLLIKTESDDRNNVQLTVQDSGVGFAPDAAERLFESFYTTKDDGMGIGLSISRSIIEAHQGRLWATANDGPGASFVFSIPRDLDHTPRRINDLEGRSHHL